VEWLKPDYSNFYTARPRQVPQNNKFCTVVSCHVFGIDEARPFKFVTQIDFAEY